MTAESTERLMTEHRLIGRVLAAMIRAANRLDDAKVVDSAFWTGAVDFLHNFADSFHHAKEEELLFELYARRGLPSDDGPVAVMLAEHEQCRLLMRSVEETAALLAAGAADVENVRHDLAAAAREFVELLEQHIQKEDNILYPMGEQLLTADDQEHLLKRFDEADDRLGGEATTARYQTLAAELAELVPE